MNLLKETKEAIEQSGHTSEQIIFIGSEESGYQCTWEEFESLADVDYNNGFGAAKVAQDLIIVFKDGQKLWRGEYDGSEWWNFSTKFKKPKVKKAIVRLITLTGWDDLEEINNQEEEV